MAQKISMATRLKIIDEYEESMTFLLTVNGLAIRSDTLAGIRRQNVKDGGTGCLHMELSPSKFMNRKKIYGKK